jgi:hypothetical protein
MPFLDRYWWLHFPLALLLATLVPFTFLSGAFVASLLTGDIPGGDALSYVLFWVIFGCIALSLGGAAVMVLRDAFTARARKRARLAALAGDMERMPLARLRFTERETPNLAREPLALLWRCSRLVRGLVIFRELLLLGNLIQLVETTIKFFSNVPLNYSLVRVAFQSVPLPLVFSGAATLVAQMWWTFVRLGRPFGLIVSEAGIRWMPLLGRVRLIPWDEALLLEVQRVPSRTAWRYLLYGRNSIARWQDGI